MGLFSRKPAPGDAAAAGPVIASTTFIEARDAGGHVHATVLTERYTEREAMAIESDLTAAAAARGHRLLLDMTNVLMLASAGIGSLIQVHRACQAAGGKLVLCNIDEQIRMMLGVAKMDRLFAIADTPTDAAKHLA